MVLLLLGGGAAALVLMGTEGTDGTDEPEPPDAWDPRVTELVRYVEDERGLRFDHPVAVDFLPEDEFRKEVTADEDELTDEDREEAEAFEGAFRALGLIEGDIDLLDEVNTLTGEGTLAFYDHDEQRVRVRGTTVTVGLRVTLVHELTHALQDQHFDLSRLDDEELTSGEYAAFQALVEGDAQRIEFAYTDSLDDEERAAYERESDEGLEGASGIEDVPEIFVTFFGAPYQLGEALVTVLEADGGNDAVNRALEDPPTSEEHLLDPWTYLDGDEPQDVAEPDPREGEEEVDAGDFGAITWLLALAERIDPRQALEAVDGWGGDAYLLYERAGRSCVRLVFRGDTDEDLDEMVTALEKWVAGMPAGAAAVRRGGDQVTLRSCDPGADSELEVQGISGEVLGLPLLRTFITVEVVDAGGPRPVAECIGREFLARLSDEQVRSLSSILYADEFTPEVQALSEAAGAACGVPQG